MRKFKVDDISLYDDAKKRDEAFFPAARIKSIMDGAYIRLLRCIGPIGA
jgi:hypothetical protein